MAELDLSGKAGDGAEKKPRGRPTTEAKQRELRADLKASLLEIADWLRDTEQLPEPETIGDLIRQRADEMADVLAAWAEKSGVVERILRKLVGKGGPLSALRAFGPLARRLIVEPFRQRRAEYDDESPDPDAPVETGFTPLA